METNVTKVELLINDGEELGEEKIRTHLREDDYLFPQVLSVQALGGDKFKVALVVVDGEELGEGGIEERLKEDDKLCWPDVLSMKTVGVSEDEKELLYDPDEAPKAIERLFGSED